MDNSMWGFIGVIVVAFGIYSIYAFFKMKFKGEISASLLLGKEYTYKKCKNKEEFIAKTAPAVLRWTSRRSSVKTVRWCQITGDVPVHPFFRVP